MKSENEDNQLKIEYSGIVKDKITNIQHMMNMVGIADSLNDETAEKEIHNILLVKLPNAVSKYFRDADGFLQKLESEIEQLELQASERRAQIVSENPLSSKDEWDKKIAQDHTVSVLEEKISLNKNCHEEILNAPAVNIELPIHANQYTSVDKYISDVLSLEDRISVIEKAKANRDYQLNSIGLIQGGKNYTDAERDLEKIVIALLYKNDTKIEYDYYGDLIVKIEGQPRLNLSKILADKPEMSHLFIDEDGGTEERKSLADRYANFIDNEACVKPRQDYGGKVLKSDALKNRAKGDMADVDGGYLCAINFYTGPMYILMNDFKRKNGKNFSIPDVFDISQESGINEGLRKASFEQQIKEVLLASVLADIGIDRAEKIKQDKNVDQVIDVVGFRGQVTSKLPVEMQAARLKGEVVRQQAISSTTKKLSVAKAYIVEKPDGMLSKLIGVKGIDFSSISQVGKEVELGKQSGMNYITTNINPENQTDTMIEVKPVATSFEAYISDKDRYKSPTEIDEKIAIQRDEAISALIHYANSKSIIPDKLDRERKQALQDVLQQLKNEPQKRQDILWGVLNDSKSVLNKHHLISLNKGETKAINMLIDLWAAESGRLRNVDPERSKIHFFGKSGYKKMEELMNAAKNKLSKSEDKADKKVENKSDFSGPKN